MVSESSYRVTKVLAANVSQPDVIELDSRVCTTDPVYTVSSEVDRARCHLKVRTVSPVPPFVLRQHIGFVANETSHFTNVWFVLS